MVRALFAKKNYQVNLLKCGMFFRFNAIVVFHFPVNLRRTKTIEYITV